MRFAVRVTVVAAIVSLLDFLVFILAEWYGMSKLGLTREGVIEHIFRTIITWWILPYLLASWAVIFLAASYLVSNRSRKSQP